MPDVLIVSKDNKTRFELEDVARLRGFRVKSAIDVEGALEWLKAWNFDLALIESGTPIPEQQKIGDILWRANPAARLIAFGANSDDVQSQFEERLFGAELAIGKDYKNRIDKILENANEHGVMSLEDFKILVVEDLDSPRDIICSYIEGLGFPKVEGLSSAKETLDRLNADPNSCSCIVTDIRMPHISGAQLIEQVRKHAKLQHLPIIVLTAYGSADSLVDCLKAGASGFLVKPPKRDDLARELGRAYRIATNHVSPRIASPDEIEQIRAVLETKGFV